MKTAEIRSKIAPVLKKYGVHRASVFGSVSRGDDTPESDVDILVSIGEPMGLLSYVRMRSELEEVLGRKVDLVTEKSLNKFVAPRIEKELQTVYEG